MIEIKRIPVLDPGQVKEGFAGTGPEVTSSAQELSQWLGCHLMKNGIACS